MPEYVTTNIGLPLLILGAVLGVAIGIVLHALYGEPHD